jgi:hypothetical protein
MLAGRKSQPHSLCPLRRSLPCIPISLWDEWERTVELQRSRIQEAGDSGAKVVAIQSLLLSVVQNFLKLRGQTAQPAYICAVHRAGCWKVHGLPTLTFLCRAVSMTCEKQTNSDNTIAIIFFSHEKLMTLLLTPLVLQQVVQSISPHLHTLPLRQRRNAEAEACQWLLPFGA